MQENDPTDRWIDEMTRLRMNPKDELEVPEVYRISSKIELLRRKQNLMEREVNLF